MFTRLFRIVGRLIGLSRPQVRKQVQAGEAFMTRYRDVLAALAK